jgi:protein arginine kinase activator
VLCQECGKRPATVHVVRVINDKRTEEFICEYCAQKKTGLLSTDSVFGVDKLLAGLLHHEDSVAGISPTTKDELECPKCKMTYGEFARTGRLGCGECYRVFEKRLDPLLKRIHGGIRHTGKIPVRIGGETRLRYQLGQLKRELDLAVLEERYERAAEIRDQIREIEENLASSK